MCTRSHWPVVQCVHVHVCDIICACTVFVFTQIHLPMYHKFCTILNERLGKVFEVNFLHVFALVKDTESPCVSFLMYACFDNSTVVNLYLY